VRTSRGNKHRLPTVFYLLACAGFVLNTSQVLAGSDIPLSFEDKPIHPACIRALAMKKGDILPVTNTVDLEGCMANPSSQTAPQVKEGIHTILLDEAQGGGSFSYRILGTLDNGIRIVGIGRVAADGSRAISVAGIDLVVERALRHGEMVKRQFLKLVFDRWVEDFTHGQVQVVGNSVRFVVRSGTSKVDRVVDLSRYKNR